MIPASFQKKQILYKFSEIRYSEIRGLDSMFIRRRLELKVFNYNLDLDMGHQKFLVPFFGKKNFRDTRVVTFA